MHRYLEHSVATFMPVRGLSSLERPASVEHVLSTFADEPAELEWRGVVMTAESPAPAPALVSPVLVSSRDMPARGLSSLERPASVEHVLSKFADEPAELEWRCVLAR